MTGTRGIGRRRGTRSAGRTLLVNGFPAGAIPDREPAHDATQVIVVPQAETEVIRPADEPGEPDAQAEVATPEELAALAAVPVPDIGSPRPEDRTEWLRLHEGDEGLFASVVADRDAAWLLDTSLPIPPRTGAAAETAEDTTSSGSGSAPPVDEAAAETTAPASADPEPVSTEDGESEPTQDEPDAEPDCAEGSDAI